MAELYPVENDYPDPFEIPPANRIVQPGAQTLYQNATGFEKALADTEAERLMDMYAEAIIDEWNPWQVAYEHLPFLAWASGVNLWESWWDETFKRNWTARQWYLKSIRGKRAGLDEFVTAVGGHVKRCVVPPARAYGTKAMTDVERAAYVARFPQVRIYPYVARSKLPWLCYNGKHYDGRGQDRVWNKNGSFMGPRRPVYPTVQTAGGKYTRTATLYEPRTGVETKLTIRRIVKIRTGEDAGWGFTPGVSQYDESVILPLEKRPAYFIREHGKYLGFNIFLGVQLPLRTISIGRSGPMELVQAKAQYQTVFPQEELLQVRPEMVSIRHPRRKTELYAAKREYLVKARSIVTHEVASNLVVGSPQFGRALFGMNVFPLSVGHPVFGTPVLTAVAGGYDTAVTTWITNVQAIGGSVSPGRANLVNNFVIGLRTDNIWNKFDRIYLVAGENQQSARVDIKVGTVATVVGSPLFTPSLGYSVFERGGTNFNLNYNLLADGVTYARDSAHASVWVYGDPGLQNDATLIDATGTALQILSKATDNNFYGRLNEAGSGGTAIGSYFGLELVSRTGPSMTRYYLNGVDFGGNTVASQAVQSTPLKLVYRNFSFVTVGGGLTAAEQLLFFNRSRTLMTAIGVP